MKKEDLNKLLIEESKGYKLDKFVIFLLILFLPGFLFPQTDLHNFGVTQTINTYKGFKAFSLVDANKDGIDDLVLYGNKQKQFVIHLGNADSLFSKQTTKFFFFPIDDLKYLTKSKNGEDYYLFVSRNKRLTGLVSFTSTNSMQLLHTLEFQSYPSVIKIFDLNKDGKNEALVFGDNFTGLELVKNDHFRLNSNKIIDYSIFKDLDTIDINQDDVTDIVTIDLLNNSLIFWENIENRDFINFREIPFVETIHKVKSIDFNHDSIIDLAVTKETGVEILLGDSVFSFEERINIPINISPTNTIFTDLNNDKNFELFVMSTKDEKFTSIFDIENIENPFYNFNGLVTSTYVKKGKQNFILSLSSEGKIKTFSKKNKWDKSFSLSIPGNVGEISFVNSENGYRLFVEDPKENLIKNFSINAEGKISDYLENNFINTFSRISKNNSLNKFASFVDQSRQIEFLLTTEDNAKNFERNFAYTTYSIWDVNFLDDSTLSVLEINDSSIYTKNIDITQNKIILKTPQLIDSSVTSYHLIKDKIYYWKQPEENEAKLFEFVKTGNFITTIKDKVGFQKIEFVKNLSGEKNNLVYSVVRSPSKFKILKISDKDSKSYLFDEKIDENNIAKNYRVVEIAKKQILVINNDKNKKVTFYEFDSSNYKMKPIKSIEVKNVNDYFVTNFFEKTYFVYSNFVDNVISFKIVDL